MTDGNPLDSLPDLMELKGRVQTHEERFGWNERRLTEIEKSMRNNLEKIYTKLDTYGDRPSWAVSAIITVLSSGVIALLTILFSRLK